tara:strand:+ start:213 stop:1208 length:996 start_codon:yes stop_codon:yes gene_type:complete
MIFSIQILRFIAASLVVLNHSLGELSYKPFGAIGVDIFFVISGFIMSYITEKNSKYFLLRRFFRIVPMYWLFTILLVFITIVTPDLLRSSRFDLSHALYSLFFIPYWTDTTAFSPILKLGWTLNFEMFFYFIFFFSMKINKKYREMISSFFLIFIYFFLTNLNLDKTLFLSFYADTIIFEFIFGMFLAVAYRRYSTIFSSFNKSSSALIFLFSLTLLYSTSFFTIFDDYRFIAWGIPSLLCVLSFLICEKYILDTNLKKFAVIGGDISYPLYLIHIYLIAFLNRVIFKESLDIISLFIISLIISCLLSYFVLIFFDNRIRSKLNIIFFDKK